MDIVANVRRGPFEPGEQGRRRADFRRGRATIARHLGKLTFEQSVLALVFLLPLERGAGGWRSESAFSSLKENCH